MSRQRRKLLNEIQQVRVEVETKLEQTIELKSAIAFLNPELDTEEVLLRTIKYLASIAEPKLLAGLVDMYNEEAEAKLAEVKNMYQHFTLHTDIDN